MQGTRFLLNKVGAVTAPAALRHKNHRFPVRSPWDIWYAAGNAAMDLIVNPKARDEFVLFSNDGIIKPQVLSQADLGYSMTLALYHDLSSPLLQKDLFSITDFMEGIEPAIENYEEVLTSLESRDLSHSSTVHDNDPSITEEEQDLKDDASIVENVVNDKTIDDGADTNNEDKKQWENQLFANLSAMADEGNAILKKQLNWKDIAISRKDSLEGELYNMVSEECFDNIQKDPRRILLHANRRMTYQENTGEIKNVALISAKAMEVLPDDLDDSDKKLSSGEDPSFADGIEQSLPVVAEMEVLYSIAQTFQTKPIITENLVSADNNEKETDDDDKETDNNEVTVNSVWVAVLHGWLRGDPRGNKELQWKLVNNRPAVEFAGI